MSTPIYKLAQLFYGAWILSAPDNDCSTGLPHDEGPLAYALRELCDRNELPQWAIDELHFSVFETGLTCIEMERIRFAAQECGVIGFESPSYTRSVVLVTNLWASHAMARVGLTLDDGRALGLKLRELLAKHEIVLKRTG